MSATMMMGDMSISRMIRFSLADGALRERIPEVQFRGAATATSTITENNLADKTTDAGARKERGSLNPLQAASRLLSGEKLVQGWTKTNFYCRQIREYSRDSGISSYHVYEYFCGQDFFSTHADKLLEEKKQNKYPAILFLAF